MSAHALNVASSHEAKLFAEIAALAPERAERLRSGHAEPDHDLMHLANLFVAALRPDDWPGDIDDSFPPALRALLRTETTRWRRTSIPASSSRPASCLSSSASPSGCSRARPEEC